MRRMLAVAAVASMSFASFAGCSEDAPDRPAPTASPSASASACSPRTAVIAWDSGSAGDRPVLVAAYTLTYAQGGFWAADFFDLKAKPIWNDSGLTSIARTSAQLTEWHTQLLASANRTGQVGTAFGTPIDFGASDTPPATPSKPSRHQFVGTVSERPYVMPFRIHCGGDVGDITGTVSAVHSDGELVAVYDCTLPETSREGREALAFCA